MSMTFWGVQRILLNFKMKFTLVSELQQRASHGELVFIQHLINLYEI